MSTGKADEAVNEACEHCGNALEFTFGEWRHRATGSIYCVKMRRLTRTEAKPAAPPAQERTEG